MGAAAAHEPAAGPLRGKAVGGLPILWIVQLVLATGGHLETITSAMLLYMSAVACPVRTSIPQSEVIAACCPSVRCHAEYATSSSTLTKSDLCVCCFPAVRLRQGCSLALAARFTTAPITP
jgi:hypothetical protein